MRVTDFHLKPIALFLFGILSLAISGCTTSAPPPAVVDPAVSFHKEQRDQHFEKNNALYAEVKRLLETGDVEQAFVHAEGARFDSEMYVIHDLASTGGAGFAGPTSNWVSSHPELLPIAASYRVNDSLAGVFSESPLPDAKEVGRGYAKRAADDLLRAFDTFQEGKSNFIAGRATYLRLAKDHIDKHDLKADYAYAAMEEEVANYASVQEKLMEAERARNEATRAEEMAERARREADDAQVTQTFATLGTLLLMMATQK